MPIRRVKLSEIKTDPQFQCRTYGRTETVMSYVERMAAGDKFPPPTVWQTEDGLILTSGFHRIAAHRCRGDEEVDVDVREGTTRDAMWSALAENRDHGLPRTRDDKRKAITIALMDAEWRTMSDRAIAKHIGVSDKTVASVRADLVATAEIRSSDTRVGQDGKKRNQNRKLDRQRLKEEIREEARSEETRIEFGRYLDELKAALIRARHGKKAAGVSA